jgi:hypothetical protein
LGFDGVNDYVEIPNAPSINSTSISVTGWFFSDSPPSGQGNSGEQSLVAKWHPLLNCEGNFGHFRSATYIMVLSLFEDETKFVGASSAYISPTDLYSSNSIIGGRWYHFAFVHDEAVGGSLFIDGNLVGTNSIAEPICTTTTNPLLFGADNNETEYWRYFEGVLDDIGIWNRPITTQEVLDIYNGGLSVGSVENALPNDVTVYPNPSNGLFTLSFTGANEGSQFVLYGPLGNEVANGRIPLGGASIDVRGLSKGLYTIVLSNDNAEVLAKRTVIVGH